MGSAGSNACEKSHQTHLDAIAQCQMKELDQSPLDTAPQLRNLILQAVQPRGKQLRARLSLTIVDALSGDFQKVYAPAASAELYHLAALILDDIEDNSEFRRGRPAVHTTTATSTAIN